MLYHQQFLLLFIIVIFSALFEPFQTAEIPQPKQYTTLLEWDNGATSMYYVDLIEARADRTDRHDISIINDLKQNKSFVIFPDGSCTFTTIHRYVPFLYFPKPKYLGEKPCLNDSSSNCDYWSGCHPYELPPTPFFMETFNNTLPIYLNLPTWHFNTTYYFHDFVVEQPPSDLFIIPANCSFSENSNHPIIRKIEHEEIC